MTQHKHILTEARKLLGVRFQHQGRDAAHGVDCLGLLLVVAAQCGVQFGEVSPLALDVPDYRLKPDADALRTRLETLLHPVENVAMQYGDILLLAIDGAAQHLALLSDYPVAGEFGMIHAYAPARKVVEHRYDNAWRKATVAVFRLPN